MGEDEKGSEGIESPIEVLWQLVEESGKWTEEIVTLSRQQIIVYLYAIFQTVLVLWFVFYNIHKEPIPLSYLIMVGICAIFLAITLGNTMIVLRRKYRNRLARRDRWRERLEILKKKEEEIEKLLSEEAG